MLENLLDLIALNNRDRIFNTLYRHPAERMVGLSNDFAPLAVGVHATPFTIQAVGQIYLEPFPCVKRVRNVELGPVGIYTIDI